MKRRLSVALSLGLFIAAGTAAPTTSHAENISSHWAYDEMNYLIKNKIMEGDDKGNYLPGNDITRAEFAKFLVEALDLPQVTATAGFKDVPTNKWYYDYVNRAAYYGLIKGDGVGFKPNANITRQEMASMLKRSLDYLNVSTYPLTLKFSDRSNIATWAKDDVARVVTAGYMAGNPNNTFAPQAQATRAEAAAVIYRVLKPETLVGKEYSTASYSTSFATALSKQANNSPKVDGGGVFTATEAAVSYYLNPNSFSKDSGEYYQFLKLSTPITNLNANNVNNKVLAGKGILAATADSFIKAGLDYEINAIYLLSHAIHETGNGTSKLARGIEVGLNASGKPEMVTAENRAKLTNIKMTYNVYGIGAIDADAEKYGSEAAYTNKWFSLKEAIIGGAKFVKEKYIGAGQDTLYKMRWNPVNPTSHQYATHIMWAVLQAKKIQTIYEATGANDTTKMVFDVPKYKSQPAAQALPRPENQYVVYPALNLKNAIGKVNSTSGLNLRSYPVTADNLIISLSNNTPITVVGENGGWYKITASGKTGWVSGQYLTFENELKVKDVTLNVRSQPNTSTASKVIGSIKNNGIAIGFKNPDGTFVTQTVNKVVWYKVSYNGQTGWVSGDYIVPPKP